MDRVLRLKRLGFRAWHRGTREADMLVGGFFDRFSGDWSDEEIAWYEVLIEEQDVDILAWAMGTAATPPELDHPMMIAMRRLDYIALPR